MVCLQPRRKPKFPKRTQITIYGRISLASAQAQIQQATANAQNHAYDICDPVCDVRAAVEAGATAAQQIGELVGSHVIPRPADSLVTAFFS